MTVQEIALRQEVRQLMAEAGINKNTIHDIAEKVICEEAEKQTKNALNQINVEAIVKRVMSSYEFMTALRDAVRSVVSDTINVKVECNTYEGK